MSKDWRARLIKMLIFTLIIFASQQTAFAAAKINDLEDGAYSVDYVILHAETESASIANDYFEKPAIIYVEGDKKFIQFPLNHSQWTKELQAPLGDDFVDVDVISIDEEEDVRIVEFELDRDFSEPLEFKMHVLIKEMEPVYDHRYTVRFDFDESSIVEIADAPERQPKMELEKAAEDKDEESAEMNEDDQKLSLILWGSVIVFILIIALAFIFINKRKKQGKNQSEDR